MAQAIVEETTQANAGWNFAVNLLDISFITLGISLVSRDTVMPVLVSTLTDSKIAVGLIAAIYGLGINLPQLLTANFTERLRFKLPFVATVGLFGERLPYLLMGVVVWFFAVPSPTLALVLFLLMVAATGFSAGSATPAWFDLIAKVIPVHRRGIWSGLGHSIGAGMAVVGAFFVGRILETFPYPGNYSLLFVLAFAATMVSWVGLILNREPPSALTKEQVPLTTYLRKLPAVLRSNANYTHFLIGRTTVQFGAMASGFFILYGGERFGLDGATIGALTGILVISQTVMTLVWGVVGDRVGHKTVLTIAAFGLALAALVAWQAQSLTWLYVTFFLLGTYVAADMVSGLNIILEFCAPEDRPTYIGLTNTLLAPMIVLAPLVGGWLATVFGFDGLLIVSMLVAAAGALLLAFWVNEPRGRMHAEK